MCPLPEASGLTAGGRELVRPGNVAFYLPQFHPVAENDAAWGAGFSEWHNVVAARPRFKGHHQPVLPGEVGFYDLRLDQTRRAQMDLAREHGIDGFCWYHYWFDGHRILNEPFDRMLRDPAEDLPFLLCWANEPWTRQWSGRSGEIIVEQRYSNADDERHMAFLIEVFADPRYITMDGKPVFLVYQPSQLPDAARTCDRWRAMAQRAGFRGLVLLGVESFRARLADPATLGLDGVVEQQPDLATVRPAWRAAPRRAASRLGLARRYPSMVRFPYEVLAARALARLRASPDARRFPTVCPGWYNSPRRDRGAVILTGASPEAYGAWLEETLRTTASPLVFVNAWNEWAEGAHLEPDRASGRAYLRAHRVAVDRAGTVSGGRPR